MNYLIKDLKKVKLYNKSSHRVIQNYTRNGKVKVIYDHKKNFIFWIKFLQIKMNIMRASITKYILIIFFGVLNFMEKNLLPQN